MKRTNCCGLLLLFVYSSSVVNFEWCVLRNGREELSEVGFFNSDRAIGQDIHLEGINCQVVCY